MNFRPLLCVSLFSLAVSVACADPAKPAPSGKPAAPATKPAEKPQVTPGPEAKLKQGMTTAEVKKIMGGDPASVRPMESPEGKAEVWTYRRRTYGRVDRVQVGTEPIVVKVQGSDGTFRDRVVGHDPVYKDQRHYTEETVSLLLFNDHFVVSKVAVEERIEIE